MFDLVSLRESALAREVSLCVPSMFDSSGVKVTDQPDGGEG
jgi:hypothetical protein